MAKYVVAGIHTRRVNGALKIWYPGDEIEPTKFELVSFPNKFVLVEPEVETVEEIEVVEVVEEIDTEEVELAELSLDELKEQLKVIIDSGEYEDSVVEEAEKLYRRNPIKEQTIAALVEEINNFLNELEDYDESGDDEIEVE